MLHLVLGSSVLGCDGHRFEPRATLGVTNVLVHELRIEAELVHVSLSGNLSDDPFVVVVSQFTA